MTLTILIIVALAFVAGVAEGQRVINAMHRIEGNLSAKIEAEIAKLKEKV